MRRTYITITAACIVIAGSVVMSSWSDAETHLESFRALSEKDAEAELLRISDEHGPEDAWQFLKEALMPEHTLIESANDSHELAHVMGQELFRRLGEQGIVVCDQAFTYGCYHGFVRASFESAGESPAVVSVCKKAPNFGGCLHGFGHALGSIEQGGITGALETCDILFTEFTFGCWEGVLMEFVKTYTPPEGHDLWDFCSSIGEKYGERCAASLPGRMSGETPSAVAAFCGRGKGLPMREACADAFGADVVHRAHGDSKIIDEACALLTSELLFKCYSSAARLVIQRGQRNALEIANDLCGRVPARIDDCEEEIKNVQESLR